MTSTTLASKQPTKLYPCKIPTIEITKMNIYFNQNHVVKYQWSALSAALNKQLLNGISSNVVDGYKIKKKVWQKSFKWYCTKHWQRPSSLQTTRPSQWQWESPHKNESQKIWKSLEYIVATTSSMCLLIEIKKPRGYNLLRYIWNPWVQQMYFN